MSEFIPINTQEEFDEAIKARLARERDTIAKREKEAAAKQYADYDNLKANVQALTQTAADNEEKMQSLQNQLTEANSKIAGYQTDIMKTNIAIAKGLPMELRDRLSGSTEEELNADADKLSKLFSAQNNSGIPLANLHQGAGSGNSRDEALKQMLQALDSKGD